MNIVKEADISASPEAAYEYLVDFPRHSEWTTPGHGVKITAASPGPVVVGSTFTSEAHQMGAQRDRIEVTELTPSRRIVYDVTMKNGDTFRHTLDMEQTSTGTHLTKRFQSLRLSLLSSLMAPVAGWLIAPKLLAGDVERIKSHLEQAGAREERPA